MIVREAPVSPYLRGMFTYIAVTVATPALGLTKLSLSARFSPENITEMTALRPTVNKKENHGFARSWNLKVSYLRLTKYRRLNILSVSCRICDCTFNTFKIAALPSQNS